MAGTQFVATMADGKMFAFFTTGDRLFFEMPEGYTGKDIVSVHPHQTLPGKVYQMMPFFTCYVNGLDF